MNIRTQYGLLLAEVVLNHQNRKMTSNCFFVDTGFAAH